MTKEGQGEETRQELRAAKLRKKKAKIQQHGKSLAKVYKDALEKRVK